MLKLEGTGGGHHPESVAVRQSPTGPACRPLGNAVGGQTIRRQTMYSTTASQEELKAHRVPLAWRDQCSAYVVTVHSCAVSPNLSRSYHPTDGYFLNRPDRPDGSPRYYAHSLLLPLNVCRKDKYYLPWECENERHAYEKCVLSWSFFMGGGGYSSFLTLNSRPQVSI